MRLICLGSGEFGLPTLQHLDKRHEMAAIITQPDRPAGRGRRLAPTPIAAWAAQSGIELLKSDNVSDPKFISRITNLGVDAAIVVAFSQKISPTLVDALGRLAINLHGSLLPKYRGAAPVNWAILNGESHTGITVISLAQRIDAGLIYGTSSPTAINPLETAGELHDRLALMGPDLIDRVLDDFATNSLTGRMQDEALVTRAPKLSKADRYVNFNATADHVQRRIHGLTPWPGAHVIWKSINNAYEQPLIIRRVASEPDLAPSNPPGTVLPDQRVAVLDGTVHLLELQLPGRRPLPIVDFICGHPLHPGDRLQQ